MSIPPVPSAPKPPAKPLPAPLRKLILYVLGEVEPRLDEMVGTLVGKIREAYVALKAKVRTSLA